MMKKTELQKATERLIGTGIYDALIVAGYSNKGEAAQFGVTGDIFKVMMLLGTLVWHIEKRTGMKPEDIGRCINIAYANYRGFATGTMSEDDARKNFEEFFEIVKNFVEAGQ